MDFLTRSRARDEYACYNILNRGIEAHRKMLRIKDMRAEEEVHKETGEKGERKMWICLMHRDSILILTYLRV